MILAIDVDYKENSANAAGIVFSGWEDEVALAEYTARTDKIKEYIPGQFYKRELPCLTSIVRVVKEEIKTIVIDGYVWLSDDYKPGLGGYLYRKYDKKIPVIGVAKRSFYSLGNNYREIFRGKSTSGLYITSAGIDVDAAAYLIKNMAGANRIPALLKRADSLCRQWN